MIYRKLQRAYWTVYWVGFPNRVPREQGQDYMTSRLAALFGLFLLLVSGVAVAQTPVVEDIRVEGNQRIEAETVRSYMNLRRGTPLTPAAVNRALKGLFATGLFSDVKMGQDGSTIVVQVVENPIINRLAFEGNKKLDDDVLAAEVQLRPRIVYTRAKVQNDVQRLLQVYRASGRFSARIEPKIIQLPQNRIDLVYEITEGDTTEIRSIRFLGNKVFSDGTLKEVISTRESAFWRLLGSSDVYSQGRVELDQALLDGYYKDRGFYDFRVVSANVELTPDQKAFFITYTVEEGAKYKVRKIDVATNLKNTNPKELRALIEAEPGDTYSAKEIGKINKVLKDAVGGKGFAFVNIREEVKPNREKQTLDIVFNIGQGRRNYIERINISGNTRTLDEVIRREIKLVEGDAYDAAQIQRSERRIKALGFFADAKLKTEPGSARDKAVINVEVEEQPTGELSVGAGFSTAEALIGDVSLRERNFLGRGQDVRLAFSLSLRRRQLDFSFTEPYFLDMPISAGIDLFNTNSDFQSQSSFTQKSLGGKLRTGMSLTDALRLTLDYGLRQDEIANVDANASQFIQQQAGVATTSSVGYSLRLDLRDDPIRPRSGSVTTLRQEFAGLGGSVRDLRSRFRHTQFFGIGESSTLKLGVNSGYVLGLGKDIRINRRFFIGGDSFRGFEASGVGPRDQATDDAIGAEMFAVGTAEFIFPLGLPEEFGLFGRVFSDFGTATGVDANGVPVIDEAAPRMTAGIGITWNSPFGPLLIDLAQPIVEQNGDKDELFRFSFGTRF